MANLSQGHNERSLRSVFVGNIPYDTSEEKLKDIFSEVGPVVSFKLVYDRETGKPKGYGFCEYRDQETASSAMRNLNSYEINGRNLRVDTATHERFREEIKNLQVSLSGSTFESPYGPECDPEKAPENIARVVSSLPPEQMFEIVKQMKHCVLTNPNEARNMLIQNPQLAYALLQLLVVMRAIDVNTASSILYKPNPPPAPIPPGNMGPIPGSFPGPMQPQPQPVPMRMPPQMFDPHIVGPPQPPPQQPPQFDQRHLDPRLRQAESRAPPELYDPRIAAQQQPAAAPIDPRLRAQAMVDPRQMPQPNLAGIRGPTPVPPATTSVVNQVPPAGPVHPMVPPQPTPATAPPPPMFPPQQPPTSFPGVVPPSTVPAPVPVSAPGATALPPVSTQQPSTTAPGQPPTPSQQPGTNQSTNQSEQEKARLIMQVLSLSDQQISLLPAEQRQSILLLRQQFHQNK